MGSEHDSKPRSIRFHRLRGRRRDPLFQRAAPPALIGLLMVAGIAALYCARAFARGENIAHFFASPEATPAPADASGERRAARPARKPKAMVVVGRPVCVRLCDGYFFPVDSAASEAACSSLCPSAPTRLYLIPRGVDATIQDAAAADGQRYSALPVALRYAHELVPGCTCHGPNVDYLAMLARDATLRPGDAVVTPHGLEVLARTGSSRQNGLFLSYAAVRKIPHSPALDAIERSLTPTAYGGASQRPAPPLHAGAASPGPAMPIKISGRTARVIAIEPPH